MTTLTRTTRQPSTSGPRDNEAGVAPTARRSKYIRDTRPLPRFFSTRVGLAGRRRAPGCRCSTCNIMRKLAAARQSVTSWICRASWSCCRSAACPWWASRSASCPPAARRRAARSPATRPCATTAIATAVCRTSSADSGTGSGSTPPRRTATSPEGTRCAPRPRGRRRL